MNHRFTYHCSALLVLLTAISSSMLAQERKWTPINDLSAPASAITVSEHGTIFLATHARSFRIIENDITRDIEMWPGAGPATDIFLVNEYEIWVADGNNAYSYNQLTGQWNKISINGIQQFARSRDGSIVAASMYRPSYRSTDNGGSWQAIDHHQFPPSTSTFSNIVGAEQSVFYAAFHFSGLWKSIDGGETWHQTPFSSTSDSLISADNVVVLDNGVILTEGADRKALTDPTRRSGIYRSSDGGNQWQLVRFNQLFSGGFPESVSAMRSDGTRILASIGFGRYSVIESRNGGDSWNDLNDGIEQDTLVSVLDTRGSTSVIANSSRLYTLAEGSSGLLEIDEEETLSLSPNPTTDHIIITYADGIPDHASISIYDASGRLIMAPQSPRASAPDKAMVNVAHLPSGAYTVALDDGTGRIHHRQFIIRR